MQTNFDIEQKIQTKNTRKGEALKFLNVYLNLYFI